MGIRVPDVAYLGSIGTTCNCDNVAAQSFAPDFSMSIHRVNRYHG